MAQREVLQINQNDYTIGDLSYFPEELDDNVSLYDVENNAIAVLTGKLSVGSDAVFVNDNSSFPNQGILHINDESIYYRRRDINTFTDLIRGFNNSKIMTHNSGSVVLGCVSSLHHNSVRDAIIKCENKTGLISDTPDINGTLTSRAKFLDIKWFTPTSRFTALPAKGPAPLKVNFRNRSLGEPYINNNYIWDFGDVNNTNVSSEKNPVHVYEKPGIYTVTLNVKTNDGKNSSLSKKNFIEVYDDNTVWNVVAYARDPVSKNRLSVTSNGISQYPNDIPLEVEFVDQTLGLVIARKWNFGDGTIVDVNTHPYDHIITHTYTEPGVYWPQLQVLDQNDTLRLYSFKQPILVGIRSVVDSNELIVGASLNDARLLSKRFVNVTAQLKTTIQNLSNSIIIK